MEITKIINSLFEIDQHLRKEKNLSTKTCRKFDKITTEIVYNILNSYGYPTISKTDKDTSKQFGLLIQHSPDYKLIEDTLQIIEKDISILNDIDKSVIPLWKDSLNIKKEKKQIFGTAFRAKMQKDGKYKIIPAYPIKDLSDIDNLRLRYGLDTLEQYYKKAAEVYEKFLAGKKK